MAMEAGRHTWTKPVKKFMSSIIWHLKKKTTGSVITEIPSIRTNMVACPSQVAPTVDVKGNWGCWTGNVCWRILKEMVVSKFFNNINTDAGKFFWFPFPLGPYFDDCPKLKSIFFHKPPVLEFWYCFSPDISIVQFFANRSKLQMMVDPANW